MLNSFIISSSNSSINEGLLKPANWQCHLLVGMGNFSRWLYKYWRLNERNTRIKLWGMHSQKSWIKDVCLHRKKYSIKLIKAIECIWLRIRSFFTIVVWLTGTLKCVCINVYWHRVTCWYIKVGILIKIISTFVLLLFYIRLLRN